MLTESLPNNLIIVYVIDDKKLLINYDKRKTFKLEAINLWHTIFFIREQLIKLINLLSM